MTPDEEDIQSIFDLQIDSIIWKRPKMDTNTNEYLVKFKNRSYRHVEWMAEEELCLMTTNGKNKISRFNKNFNKRLQEGNYDEEAIEEGKFFDPAYLEVDRIIASTELFPIVHQKKVANIIFRLMK